MYLLLPSWVEQVIESSSPIKMRNDMNKGRPSSPPRARLSIALVHGHHFPSFQMRLCQSAPHETKKKASHSCAHARRASGVKVLPRLSTGDASEVEPMDRWRFSGRQTVQVAQEHLARHAQHADMANSTTGSWLVLSCHVMSCPVLCHGAQDLFISGNCELHTYTPAHVGRE